MTQDSATWDASASEPRALKAVILANEARPGGLEPMMLQPLGDRRVLDYIVDNALRSVSRENLYVVVSNESRHLRAHLGGDFQYVVQRDPLGTGHAVLQLQPALRDFHGDLLILFGDTPLVRPESIRGLLNRHRLRQSHFTLVTATVNRALPYGRIVRDAAGKIEGIVEPADASADVLAIRELNVGASVACAQTVLRALEASSRETGAYRLTDCVRTMVRTGLRVESYAIYDQDEMLGIHGPDDLTQAEFVLQKRLHRSRGPEDQTLVRFGTGGWRAIIGEGFTLQNVRRVAQALANDIIRRGGDARGVIIGFDRRFLSDRAAEVAAEVFAANNIPVLLLSEDAPTPLVTYATALRKVAYGLVFTASHNPPEWNGLKVFCEDGSLLPDEESARLEAETNRLTPDDVVTVTLAAGLEAGMIQRTDFTNAYVDAVESLINLETIRDAGLKVIVDPMYGVGQLTLGIVLTEARCRVTFIHDRKNPLFGGRSPAPNFEALQQLSTLVTEGGYDLGLATDGDADRIAIIDERGAYVPVNDILLLLYWYLHQVRGERGGIVRNIATTHLVDRLAQRFGEASYEVPVGFRHVASAMVEHDALLGGESSGGLTIRGHIRGKDGIFAAALIVEMRARTGQTISELRENVYRLTGRLYSVETNVPSTPEMRVVVPRRIREQTPRALGAYPVRAVSFMDGTKFLLDNDNWVLLRFSGTEPLLRLFAEADSPEKARELVGELARFAGVAA